MDSGQEKAESIIKLVTNKNRDAVIKRYMTFIKDQHG